MTCVVRFRLLMAGRTTPSPQGAPDERRRQSGGMSLRPPPARPGLPGLPSSAEWGAIALLPAADYDERCPEGRVDSCSSPFSIGASIERRSASAHQPWDHWAISRIAVVINFTVASE